MLTGEVTRTIDVRHQAWWWWWTTLQSFQVELQPSVSLSTAEAEYVALRCAFRKCCSQNVYCWRSRTIKARLGSQKMKEITVVRSKLMYDITLYVINQQDHSVEVYYNQVTTRWFPDQGYFDEEVSISRGQGQHWKLIVEEECCRWDIRWRFIVVLMWRSLSRVTQDEEWCEVKSVLTGYIY